MTYGSFNAAIRAAVWPDGEPENLVVNHKNFILDALIDLQIKLPRLQQNHTDWILPEQTLYHCFASIFDAPRGFIVKLSTLLNLSSRCCEEIEYRSCSKAEIDCQLENVESCSPCSTEYHPYQPYAYFADWYAGSPQEFCLEVPDASLDKPCRATRGFFAYFRGKIWVTPHLQSNEVIKLLWDGLKRTFADTDELDETLFDREVMLCVEHYLRGKAAASDDCDYTRAIYYDNENPTKPGLYQIKRADMIHTAAKEQRMLPRNYCLCTC